MLAISSEGTPLDRRSLKVVVWSHAHAGPPESVDAPRGILLLADIGRFATRRYKKEHGIVDRVAEIAVVVDIFDEHPCPGLVLREY